MKFNKIVLFSLTLLSIIVYPLIFDTNLAIHLAQNIQNFLLAFTTSILSVMFYKKH
ncbi:hypothetical protein ALAU109921_14695 [Alteromonas australica]